MALEKQRNAMMALLIICCILCSGCITDDGNDETETSPSTVAPTTAAPTTLPPTTMPPNVDTTPILFSELQAERDELLLEYESKGREVQEMLDEMQEMVEEKNPDYAEMMDVHAEFKETMTEYLSAQIGYYHDSILLEHTTPTEDDLLILKKETLPFVRPGGKVYTFGELNMVGGSYNYLIDNQIKRLIQKGIEGHDVREELIDAFNRLKEFLPGYYDMWIGYVYYYLGSGLFRQSLYSDILIRDCNPYCI